MKTLRITINNDLHEAVLAQAEREHGSVDALISRTLRAAVALPLLGLTVHERAERANWEDFDRIMARIPDAPPVLGDERQRFQRPHFLRRRLPRPHVRTLARGPRLHPRLRLPRLSPQQAPVAPFDLSLAKSGFDTATR